MSEGIDFKKIVIRFIKEDLRIIATFLFVLLLIIYGFAMMMGALSIGTVDFRTPSINPVNKSGLPDTDSDSLPDIIEGTPSQPCTRGENVVYQGQVIGQCTETDHTQIDSDNDLYTDGVEDAIGTNPTNFFSPGWIYIVIFLYIAAYLFFNVYGADPLKEYKEFEMKASSGVSGGSGKFAYGGKSSVFGEKDASEVSEEKKKQAIAQDARFQRMTAENEVKREPVKKKRNIGALMIQLAIATLLSIFIFIAARN